MMFGEFEEINSSFDKLSTRLTTSPRPKEKICNAFNDRPRPDVGLSVKEEISILTEGNFDLPLEDRIIDSIAKRNEIIVKTQQRNEPDFTFEERKAILSEALKENPCKFLYRFGKHLEREHLLYFNGFPGPEMQFYVQETQKLLNDSTKRVKLRNRRFGAFCKMESSSNCSYFSEDEMRKREPLLYQELVGKNLTDEEITQRNCQNTTNEINSFSELLFEQIDRNVVRDLRQEQETMEEDCYEEGDDDTDSDDDDDEFKDLSPPDEGEKELLRDEFKNVVCSEFLAGRDQEFDYSQVDDCEENDLLDWESRDEEERYFDQEEPCTLQDGCHYDEEKEVSPCDDAKTSLVLATGKLTVNENHIDHMDDGS